MILALHIQLGHNFVEQIPSNTPFSLIPFDNGIHQICNYAIKNISRNPETLCLHMFDLLLT